MDIQKVETWKWDMGQRLNGKIDDRPVLLVVDGMGLGTPTWRLSWSWEYDRKNFEAPRIPEDVMDRLWAKHMEGPYGKGWSDGGRAIR